jgi:hypothetical protein
MEMQSPGIVVAVIATGMGGSEEGDFDGIHFHSRPRGFVPDFSDPASLLILRDVVARAYGGKYLRVRREFWETPPTPLSRYRLEISNEDGEVVRLFECLPESSFPEMEALVLALEAVGG